MKLPLQHRRRRTHAYSDLNKSLNCETTNSLCLLTQSTYVLLDLRQRPLIRYLIYSDADRSQIYLPQQLNNTLTTSSRTTYNFELMILVVSTLLCRFCGKIGSIDFDESSKSATIHFEKAQAAKTALMLNGGTLDGSHLSVTSDSVHHDTPEEESAAIHHPEDGVDQTDKPRAGSTSLTFLFHPITRVHEICQLSCC